MAITCDWMLQIPDELRTAPDKTEKPQARFQSLTKVGLSERLDVLEWVSEYGLTFHPTVSRSFWGRFLQATKPSQQCQSTEGRNGLLRYKGSSSWEIETIVLVDLLEPLVLLCSIIMQQYTLQCTMRSQFWYSTSAFGTTSRMQP